MPHYLSNVIRGTYSYAGTGDPALTSELSDPEAPPEAVDGHQEHDGVEAEEDEDREVEEVLGPCC